MTFLFLTLSSFSQFPTYKRAVGTGEELAKLGHRVLIAVMDCEENRRRMAMEAPHCETLWFSPGGVWREVCDKIKLVRRYRPDVVYSTSYSLRNLAFLRLLLPRSSRMIVEFCELYSLYGRTKRTWRIKERLALRENDYILCASQFILGHFLELMGRSRIKREAIYSPYAYPNYLAVRQSPAHPGTIVFMAALQKVYGVYDVVAACANLLKKGHNIELEILGGGPEKDSLKELIAQQGLERSVHVRGFVPEEELNAYFSKASVFVSPLNNTVQDKARCPSKVYYYLPYNKPIVTCALGDPLAALGNSGFYYRPGDVDDMGTAILRALNASSSFSYPPGFVEQNSWGSRARQLLEFLV